MISVPLNRGRSKMLYIVVEESMGFGGGGWSTGYYIYLIRKGKVVKRIRTADVEPTLGTLKFMLKEFGIEYKIRKVGYPPKSNDFCKQLVKVLCKETEND